MFYFVDFLEIKVFTEGTSILSLHKSENPVNSKKINTFHHVFRNKVFIKKNVLFSFHLSKCVYLATVGTCMDTVFWIL